MAVLWSFSLLPFVVGSFLIFIYSLCIHGHRVWDFCDAFVCGVPPVDMGWQVSCCWCFPAAVNHMVERGLICPDIFFFMGSLDVHGLQSLLSTLQ